MLIFALLAAIYSVFKGRTDVRKCYFHFRQAITRHLKNKGNNAYRMVLFRLTFLFDLTKNLFIFTACEPFPVTDKGYLPHERKAMMNFTETLYYQPTREDFYALWNRRSPQLQNCLSTFHKYFVKWFINCHRPDTWAHYSLIDTERHEGKHVTCSISPKLFPHTPKHSFQLFLPSLQKFFFLTFQFELFYVQLTEPTIKSNACRKLYKDYCLQ